MTKENTTMAKRSVIVSLANRLECDPAKLVSLLQKTAFAKCQTPEEFQVLCLIANKHNLNPLTKEIYAFPSKSGAVVPIVSIDGWLKIINRHPALDGIEFEEGDDYCTAIVFRKDRGHPTKVTEWLSECRGTTEPWTRWPKRMLRHKALIQCARVAFGFAGIYDEDEGERIAIAQAAEVAPKLVRRATAAELVGTSDLAPALPSVPDAKEEDVLSNAGGNLAAGQEAVPVGDFLE
jgi:phage recombination protein Bet